MSDWFSTNELIIQFTMINLLLALSVQVPFRFGVFSFSGLGAYAIGAYTAGIVMIRAEVDAWLAIAAAALLAAVVCYLFSFLISRLDGLYLGMATIAFDLILTVVALNGGDLTGGAVGLYGVLGSISTWQIALLVVVVLAVLLVSEHGRVGRRIEAVRVDPQLATALGIRVVAHRQAAFAVSGLLGGAAGGIAVTVLTTVAPTAIGFHLLVTALTMIILGGAGSALGAVIGAVVLTWLPEALEVVAEWQLLIFGLIVAVLAIWLPHGILGAVQDGIAALRRRRRGSAAHAAAPPSQGSAALAGRESS